MRNYREALTVHEQALARNPQDALAFFGRGWAYLSLGKHQLALSDFQHVLELTPNYGDSNPGGFYNGLRWAYYFTGQYEQALSTNDHLLEREPGEYSSYLFRGRCLLEIGEYQRSLEECNYALELAPEQANVYMQRGLTYLWLNNLQQAQADFARGCELKPKSIYNVLVTAWVRMCQEAVDAPVAERLEAIAATHPQNYSAHICQGIALLLRGQYLKALAEFEQALLLEQNDQWEVYFWKGMACAFLGQDAEAMASVTKALDLHLPPILLVPLRWLEKERLEFYEQYIVPILATYG